MQNHEAGEFSGIAIKYPFFNLPEGFCLRDDNLYVPAVNISLEEEEGTAALIQLCKSLEAFHSDWVQPSASAMYMLAERFRLIRCGPLSSTGKYTIIAGRAFADNGKWQSLIEIKDGSRLVYNAVYGYRLLEEKVFQKQFAHLKREVSYQEGWSLADLPEAAILDATDPYRASLFVPEIDVQVCRGHFPGYPIVPDVYAYLIIQKEVRHSLGKLLKVAADALYFERVDFYSRSPLPPGCPFIVETELMKLTPRVFQVVATIFRADETLPALCTIVMDIVIPESGVSCSGKMVVTRDGLFLSI